MTKATNHVGRNPTAINEPWFNIDFDPRKTTGARRDVQENYKKSSSEALAEIIPQLYRKSANMEEDLESRFLPLLNEYVEFDTAWMATSSITSKGPVFNTHRLMGLQSGYVKSWLQIRSLDTITPRLIKSPGKAIVMSRSEVPLGTRFEQFLSVYRIAQAMCVVYIDLAEQRCSHVALYREHVQPPFASRDKHILEQAGSSFMAAIGRSANSLPNTADPAALSALEGLTPKERQVSRLFAEGLTYKAIAKQLGISPFTVRHHLRSVYSKLNIRNKGEIAWFFSKLTP